MQQGRRWVRGSDSRWGRRQRFEGAGGGEMRGSKESGRRKERFQGEREAK